jgi:hypothetical protein
MTTSILIWLHSVHQFYFMWINMINISKELTFSAKLKFTNEINLI